MSAPSCPLCESSSCATLQTSEPLDGECALVESTLSTKGDIVTFWICRRCALVFRTPRPTRDALAHYYGVILAKREPEILRKMGVSRATMDARNRMRYSELYEELRRRTSSTRGHIIDLGGWDGASLAPWRSAGWRTTLVDPSAAARSLDQSEMHVAATATEAIAAGGPPADIITSYHCVEHIDSLAAWADEVRPLSSAGTLWVIEVPLDLVHIRGLLGRAPIRSPQIHEEHLNFFTPRALHVLGARLGLSDLSVKMAVTLYYFGPVVSLRLYGRKGRRPTLERPSERSVRRLRAELAIKVPVWRRLAGARFRWYRATHPSY